MARFETKFISQTLLRSVEMTVIIPSPTIPESLGVADRPASYEVKDPYPVLYLLHGLGNDQLHQCRTFCRRTVHGGDHDLCGE